MPKHWKLAPDTPKKTAQDIIENFGSHALERQQKARKKTFYLTTVDEDELISSQQRKYYFKFIVVKWGIPYFQQYVDKPVDKDDIHYTLKWSKKLNLWDSEWDKTEQSLDGNKNIVRSITNLTTAQMSEFIERCILFAAEKGYQIPQPCEADYDEYFLMG